MEETQFNNEETEQTPVDNEVEEELDQESQDSHDHEPDKSLDSNIVALREANKRMQKERDEYARKLQEMEYNRQQENSRQQPQQKKEEESNYSPDDLVEWKVVQRELAKRDEQFKRYQQQTEASSTEIRLRNEYPDFDSIVSADNIQLLNQLEPELSESIGSNPNMYKKAVAAYKAIKRFSIASTSSDSDKVKKNSLKPKPTNATSPQTSDSPLSKANAFGNSLSEEQRKNIWREMQEITGRR